jgi:hypothetical protein
VEAIETLKRIFSRWVDDPDSDHPYVLAAPRLDDYVAGDAEWLDPAIEFDFAAETAPGLESRGRGRDDWWRWWRGWLEAWGEYRFGLRDWAQADGVTVLVDFDIAASGELSGAPTTLGGCQVFTLREGRIAGLRQFTSREEALAALSRESGE